jgi:hypothetical protein
VGRPEVVPCWLRARWRSATTRTAFARTTSTLTRASSASTRAAPALSGATAAAFTAAPTAFTASSATLTAASAVAARAAPVAGSARIGLPSSILGTGVYRHEAGAADGQEPEQESATVHISSGGSNCIRTGHDPL